MNDFLHNLIANVLSVPAPAWAVIASTLVGAALPWILEGNVPTEDWSGWHFRLTAYGITLVAGMIAGITIWHSWTALVLWVPPLAVQCARDIASHFFPWLSPRQQQLVVRRNQQGQVVAIKDGEDPTIIITSPSPTAASVPPPATPPLPTDTH